MNNKRTFNIDKFPWDDTGYKPVSSVEMTYDDNAFYLHFKSEERYIRAVQTQHNTQVCCDSCMEAFISFLPEEDKSYINFEINPNGVMKCARGKDRYDRVDYSETVINSFDIKTEVDTDSWQAWITIPVEFIKKEYPKYQHESEKIIRANFYKCGDETEIPHWGCWNNIVTEKPDFHLSEFFADIIL